VENLIFDSHAHYDDEAFDADRDEVLAKIQAADVKRVLNCGANLAGCEKTIELAAKHDFIYGAVGIHPEHAEQAIQNINLIGDMLGNKKIVALGEIGLDYYYENYDKEVQIRAFREQMDIAKSLGLPVVIHDRDAHEDTLKVLKEFKGVTGVLHCFSGSTELAKEILKLDYFIGFTGVVTFKNARKAIEVLHYVPTDKILAETDCPYMAPVPHRGERCNSSFLLHTINKIAEIKNMDYVSMCKQTFDNASLMLNLK
jgi:TatD DNase family protein